MKTLLALLAAVLALGTNALACSQQPQTTAAFERCLSAVNTSDDAMASVACAKAANDEGVCAARFQAAGNHDFYIYHKVLQAQHLMYSGGAYMSVDAMVARLRYTTARRIARALLVDPSHLVRESPQREALVQIDQVATNYLEQ